MSMVSNTGPLIALAKVDRLDVLAPLFGHVRIPLAVYRELMGKSGPEAMRLDEAMTTLIRVERCPSAQRDSAVEAFTRHLDAGEREALILAATTGSLLMIDDRAGRQAARRLNLPVTGTVGVLIQAKQEGLIAQVRPVLEDMRHYGYWLSDALVEVATRLSGEAEA